MTISLLYLILAIHCISVTLIKKEQKQKQTNKKDKTKKHEIIQCKHIFK